MRVGGQVLQQVQVVGQGGAYDEFVVEGGGVEVGHSRGFGQAAHVVTLAVAQGFLYLRPADVVLHLKAVSAVVIEHLALQADDRHPQFFVDVAGDVLGQFVVPQAVAQVVQLHVQAFVVVLQLHVQQFHLILLLALVLVRDEAQGESDEQGNDRKEKPPAECDAMSLVIRLQSSIHILSGLRCICHTLRFSCVGG